MPGCEPVGPAMELALLKGANDFAAPGREFHKTRFLTYALHMVRQCIIGNYGAESLGSD